MMRETLAGGVYEFRRGIEKKLASTIESLSSACAAFKHFELNHVLSESRLKLEKAVAEARCIKDSLDHYLEALEQQRGDTLNLREENIKLKEVNLELRQEVWNFKRGAPPSEPSHNQELELLRSELEVSVLFYQRSKARAVKTSKWAIRKFQKIQFFLTRLRDTGFNDTEFDGLCSRLNKYIDRKPWRQFGNSPA